MTRISATLWIAALAVLLLGGAVAGFLISRQQRSAPGPGPGAKPPAPAWSGQPWFRDMTAASGLDFTFRNGEEANHHTILESLGGGVALFDYDNDGLLDVFLVGGGSFTGPEAATIQGLPCKLYRNLGGWKFRDVTAEVGLDRPWSYYTQGTAVADFDRDGWPDLLVTGYGRMELFHNQPHPQGGRRLVEVASSLGLVEKNWTTSAGWADVNGDGFPDLYVCCYVDWSFANHPACPGAVPTAKRDICGPSFFRPLRHQLFINDQGRRFRSVAAEQGFTASGCGLGVLLADLNDDARPDIFVANDTNNKFLYMNRGNGRLEEIGMRAGVAVDDTGRPNGSMGVDAADYDGSGRPSLWVTNFQTELPGLYLHLGNERFHFQSRAAGVGAIGQHLVGFGTAFIDLDNDGWEDLVIVNGHILRHPPGGNPKQRPYLLHNGLHEGRRYFKDVSAQGGAYFQTPALGRGLAVGDLDNDGWPDLVVSHTNSPVALLRNEAAPSLPAKTHWLGVRLVGKDQRDVVGATVRLEGASRRLTRFAKGGGSYLSVSDPRILFGLDTADKPGRVSVQWSWGKTQTWDGLGADAYWELREGEPQARKINTEVGKTADKSP